MNKNISPVAENILRNSSTVIKSAKDIKENGFSFTKLRKLVQDICVVVEVYTKEVGILSSNTKAELAADLVTALVDIPFVPQWIEKKIYIFTINNTVSFLNKKFGDKWILKVNKVLK